MPGEGGGGGRGGGGAGGLRFPFSQHIRNIMIKWSRVVKIMTRLVLRFFTCLIMNVYYYEQDFADFCIIFITFAYKIFVYVPWKACVKLQCYIIH